MHAFHEIVDRCAAFTLSALNRAQGQIECELQDSGATVLVKSLQMVQLQRVISSVGMLSIFDASLQSQLQCKDGFKAAEILLRESGAYELLERFTVLRLAVNVLKHGAGRSYDELLDRKLLPFRIKSADRHCFEEGDVSEVDSLIEVDDAFVMACADAIRDISRFITESKPRLSL